MIKNPSLYEINTRVWIKRFNNSNSESSLNDVPESYWDNIAAKGFDYIWLMGIWKTCDSVIDKYCFEPGLVRNYRGALKDWTREDIIGSPYAIDKYEVNPNLGSEEEVIKLRSKLNERGVKLILDFVPNHFSADSSLIVTDPDIFLSADIEYFMGDQHTFYQPIPGQDEVFAHGRDPFFPAWQDTIQVNYCSPYARGFMINTLMKLTEICDGVRCDMAMLALNNVFKNTWGGVLSKLGYNTPEEEYWKTALDTLKNNKPDFLFLAEAYWDLEWKLQQLGFDYTYDKKLTDRLKIGYIPDIKDHLLAEEDYQKRSIRFLENHDEERGVSAFGKARVKPAAVICGTLPGMHFYYDGQLEGKRIKLPVQLGREPEEPPINCILEFYDKLMSIIHDDVFKKGEWSLINLLTAWEGNESHNNILSWLWMYKNEKRLVTVNYSPKVASARIKLDMEGYPENFELVDILNNQAYIRSAEEVHHTGLYIELKAYQSYIFSY